MKTTTIKMELIKTNVVPVMSLLYAMISWLCYCWINFQTGKYLSVSFHRRHAINLIFYAAVNCNNCNLQLFVKNHIRIIQPNIEFSTIHA